MLPRSCEDLSRLALTGIKAIEQPRAPIDKAVLEMGSESRHAADAVHLLTGLQAGPAASEALGLSAAAGLDPAVPGPLFVPAEESIPQTVR